MQIICKIKKALKIESPAPYLYCNLGLNPKNKKKCKKCRHFKMSVYYINEVGKAFVEGMAKGIKEANYRITKYESRDKQNGRL